MTTLPSTAPLPPLPDDAFIPQGSPYWKGLGLPGRTKTYADAGHGLLELVRLGGRTGCFLGEARRYIRHSATPFAVGNKRDTSHGVVASLRSRGAR